MSKTYPMSCTTMTPVMQFRPFTGQNIKLTHKHFPRTGPLRVNFSVKPGTQITMVKRIRTEGTSQGRQGGALLLSEGARLLIEGQGKVNMKPTTNLKSLPYRVVAARLR